jgi:hypothetical protein
VIWRKPALPALALRLSTPQGCVDASGLLGGKKKKARGPKRNAQPPTKAFCMERNHHTAFVMEIGELPGTTCRTDKIEA